MPARLLVPRGKPSNTPLSHLSELHPLPFSLPYYAPCWTVSVCPGSPHHGTILADLRPPYYIAAPVSVCRPLVDSQEGRHAGLPEQLIYFYHRSFRSQSLRLLKPGVPDHWGDPIPVPTLKCTSHPIHIVTLLTRCFNRNQWLPFSAKTADQRF